MKPKHVGGYKPSHTELCERTLLTLLRGLGPWKSGIFLAGGLVPRYLIGRLSGRTALVPHAGTTDVDLILDLQFLAEVDAYHRLEQNLETLGFERGRNEEGREQNHSWRKPFTGGVTVVVDLLCDPPDKDDARLAPIPGGHRLSALRIPGAHLVQKDFVEIKLTGELLDDRGVATENLRVANLVPFLVLKTLAYDDRFEEKDAYDIVYCLMFYPGGPSAAAEVYANRLARWPEEFLLHRALEILRSRFASDSNVPGSKKDGPISYARFLTDPGQPDLNAKRQNDAADVVDSFLAMLSNRCVR